MLAERFDLVTVGRLAGHARLDRCGGQTIRLRGRLEADVVQSCVVSLEDVAATVAVAFECRFARAGSDALESFAWDQDIERLDGAELDLGEIFAQQLSLALDPYPRATDAYTLVPCDLGPNIAFGEDEPIGALAVAMMDGGAGHGSAQARSRVNGCTKEEGIEVEAKYAPCASSLGDGQPDRVRELRRAQAGSPHLRSVRPLQWPRGDPADLREHGGLSGPRP